MAICAGFVFLFPSCIIANHGIKGEKIVAATPPADIIFTLPNPYLQWEPTMTPDIRAMGSYLIEIASDMDFNTLVDQDEVPATISWYVPNMLFNYGQSYYWRITPIDAYGTSGTPTATRSFSIIAQPPVYNIPIGTSFTGMKSIIASAAANTPAIVRFAQGTHTFDPGTDSKLMDLVNVDDLIIEGAGTGADIIVTKGVGYLYTTNCHNVLFNNMTFDLDPLRYTAGIVLSKDTPNGNITMELMPNHPTLESDPVLAAKNGFYLLQDNPPRPSENATKTRFDCTWTNLAGNQYRLTLTEPARISEINVGDITVIEDRYGSGSTPFWSTNSEDTVYYNIVAYAACSEGFSTRFSDRVRILKSGFTLKPGRYLACNGGGTNFHDNRLGPWMEECWIANVGDDGSNANTLTSGVQQIINSTTLDIDLMGLFSYISPNPEKAFMPGDLLLFLNPTTGNYIKRRVVSSTVNPDNTFRVIIDGEVGTINPGNPRQDSSVTRVYNLNRLSPGYVQRFNTYQYVQRRPLVGGGMGGLFEGCTIIGCGYAPLNSEGPKKPYMKRHTDMVIRDLYIEDGWRVDNVAEVDKAAIHFDKSGNQIGMDWHRNILFENITIVNGPATHYDITYTSNYIISDNLTFNPVADAYVNENFPNTNYGTSELLKLRNSDSSKTVRSFLKFTVSGVQGNTVTSAKLRLFSMVNMQETKVRAVNNTTWGETTIKWSNQPLEGILLDAITNVVNGQWYEFDVSGSMTDDGTYSFRLTNALDDINLDGWASRESSNPPELKVTYRIYWNEADFDGNGLIDIADFATLGAAWQSTPDQDNYNEKCDLQDDEIIDFADFVRFCEVWLW